MALSLMDWEVESLIMVLGVIVVTVIMVTSKDGARE